MDNAQCPSGGCHQCPRDCGVLREAGAIGYCGMPVELYVSRIAPHRWEEPPISGTCGSGTVFLPDAVCVASSARTGTSAARGWELR